MTDINIMRAHERKSSQLVVMLPGLNGSGLELGQLPKFLEDHDFTVSLPNIAGYEYGHPASDMNNWLAQLHEFLDSQSNLYEKIHLLGISMGATLALAAAQVRPDINSVTLLSPVLRYDGWSVPWYRPLLDLSYHFGFRDWDYRERDPFGLKNVDLRKRIARKFEASKISEVGSVSISIKHLMEAKHLMKTAYSNLSKLTSNALVIASIEDDTCSVWGAEQILKHVSSEYRRAVWLGNSYHIITIDNEREFVLNEVLRFLDACRGLEQGISEFDQRQNVKKLKPRGISDLLL